MNNNSLYIHIPFCKKKCAYCAFFSLCRPPVKLIDDYFEAMSRQLSLLPETHFSTVYFGGGTPTYAGTERCVKLLELIAKQHKIDSDAEITIEANPATVTASELKQLRSSGFNRISIGLQSANNDVLSAMGRAHTVKDFTDCYERSLAAGFFNISVDIIFGLPHEYGSGLDETLQLLQSLSPPHISAYSLSVECGTRLYKQKGSLSFPDEGEEDEEYRAVCAAFSDYEHYEISSFAKTGFRSRHNSAYWNLTHYIGIGAGAHSFHDGKRFSYPCDVNLFIAKSTVPFGSSNYFDAAAETARDLDEERIMLGLRTSDGALLSKEQGIKAQTAVKAGLAAFDGDRLILNEPGYRVSNEIIAEILA